MPSMEPVALMRLTETDDPDELLKECDRDDLVVEHKLDGWKTQIVKKDGKVSIYSRRGQEVTENFPEIAKALSGMPDGTHIEGELVYWNGGKQEIGKMTSLANSSAEKSRSMAKSLPGTVKFHAYDIIRKGGSDVSGKPFSERRKMLESAVRKSEKIKITEQYPFSSWQDETKRAVKSGGEGIVIKLKSATYHWKPSGEREPKPSGTMWKYKGGGGKSDSDDFVVYDMSIGEKGKAKAKFGQYYKDKLYHISEISNLSAEDEKKFRKKLNNGPFVIEIGFQERVPKGLRHQKFLRFRDDKGTKDATMGEFHAKHIGKMKLAKEAMRFARLIALASGSAKIMPFSRSCRKSLECGDKSVTHRRGDELGKYESGQVWEAGSYGGKRWGIMLRVANVERKKCGEVKSKEMDPDGDVDIVSFKAIIDKEAFLKGLKIPSYQELVDHLKSLITSRKSPSEPPTVQPGLALERHVPSGSTKANALTAVPEIDVRKAYNVIAGLESRGKFVVGDSGTSFGTVQVQLGSFVRQLMKDRHLEEASGLSRDELANIAASWREAYSKLRKAGRKIWKPGYVRVDESAVRETMKNKRKVSRWGGKLVVRHSPQNMPGIVVKRNGRFVGLVLDLDYLRNEIGLNVNRYMDRLYLITGQYITSAVVRNSIARLLVEQKTGGAFSKFSKTFTSRNVNGNASLRALADRASQRNFSARARSVMQAIRESGYDVGNPQAFNAYQLLAISNASGVGRVRDFLMNCRLFTSANLYYLKRGNIALTRAGIPSRMPPRGGIAGFPTEKLKKCRISAAEKLSGIVATAAEMTEPIPGSGIAGAVKYIISRYFEMREIPRYEMQFGPVAAMFPLPNQRLLKVVLKGNIDISEVRGLLPDKMGGFDIEYIEGPKRKYEPSPSAEYEVPAEREFEREQATPADVVSLLPLQMMSRYIHLLGAVKKQLDEEGKSVSDRDLKATVLMHVADEHGMSKEDLEGMVGTSVGEFAARAFCESPPMYKRASATLAFPGQFAEDVKSGKRNFTIRPGDMPFRPEEVVTAVTYSGAKLCRIRILSKEKMSLNRIEKAFGSRCAKALERRFGPNRRFVVIRFERFDMNEADDSGDDSRKASEVLIDGAKTLTRSQIQKHYSKPAVRKSIMSRIKGKPVLVYIGVGKNNKVLKRNHDGKEIVITGDDQSGDENPSNYWYWVKRRVLSFHEVFGTKTDLGFVDLDLHGGYPIKKAKEYARKLVPEIRKRFGAEATIYESGGTGLHVEFRLGEKTSTDKLRKDLRSMLDDLNENFEGATTGVVKDRGMRTDVSTLHNKGSIRVPGSLGETQGKVKKKISSSKDVDDNYGNLGYGQKHISDGPEASGREGAFSPRPPSSVGEHGGGGWNASDDGGPRWYESDGDAVGAFSSRIDMFRKAGDACDEDE